MSFIITCQSCGASQDISKMINNLKENPNIIIDIAFEELEEEGNIIIQCQNNKCKNTFEF